MKRNKMTTMPGLPTFRDRGIEIVYVLEYTMPKSLDSIIRAYDNEKDALLEAFKQIDKGSKESYVAELELNDWETLDNQNTEHGLWIGDLAKRDCFVFSDGKPRFTKSRLFIDEIVEELEYLSESIPKDYDLQDITEWNVEKAKIILTKEFEKELMSEIKKLDYVRYLDEDYNFQNLLNITRDSILENINKDEVQYVVYSLQYAPDFNDDTHNTNSLEEMLEYIENCNIDLVRDEAVIAKILIDGNSTVLELIKVYEYETEDIEERE